MRALHALAKLWVSFVKLRAALGRQHSVVRLGAEKLGQLTSKCWQQFLVTPQIFHSEWTGVSVNKLRELLLKLLCKVRKVFDEGFDLVDENVSKKTIFY